MSTSPTPTAPPPPPSDARTTPGSRATSPSPVPPPPPGTSTPVPGAPSDDPATPHTPDDDAGTPRLPRVPMPAVLHHMTLRTRMVVLIVTFLVVGLAISTLAATTLLSSYLLEERDRQLTGTAEAITQLDNLASLGDSPVLPSTYVAELQTASGARVPIRSTSQQYTYPSLPDLTGSRLTNGAPFTVAGGTTGALSTTPTTDWRVVALDVTFRSPGGQQAAVLVVAMPLADLDATTAQLWKILAGASLAIAVIGGSAGYLAVRRSLRPLRVIEQTARKIADGNMGERIPPLPADTEVGAVAASLNVMLGTIERSFDVQAAQEARMRRFVSDASHELRTPLVSIRGYAELFRMGAVTTPEQTAETMSRIETSAVQMGVLVEDLLSLARLDENRPMRPEDVDLRELVDGALADLHAMDPTRPTASVVLAPDGTDVPAAAAAGPGDAQPGPPPPPPVLVHADLAQLRQVLTNLIGNIVKHTPEGTPVEVAVGVVGDRAVAEVRDHGPGIPAEHRELVFERFHRVDPSRNSSSGGSGLGMAIVRSIVRAHGGQIAVHETPGGGATVRLDLPLPARTVTPTGRASERE